MAIVAKSPMPDRWKSQCGFPDHVHVEIQQGAAPECYDRRDHEQNLHIVDVGSGRNCIDLWGLSGFQRLPEFWHLFVPFFVVDSYHHPKILCWVASRPCKGKIVAAMVPDSPLLSLQLDDSNDNGGDTVLTMISSGWFSSWHVFGIFWVLVMIITSSDE